jgi:hypothetical protein
MPPSLRGRPRRRVRRERLRLDPGNGEPWFNRDVFADNELGRRIGHRIIGWQGLTIAGRKSRARGTGG